MNWIVPPENLTDWPDWALAGPFLAAVPAKTGWDVFSVIIQDDNLFHHNFGERRLVDVPKNMVKFICSVEGLPS